jgi:putative SOS response-associated peptidase YedK
VCGRYDLSQNPAAIRAQFSVPSVPEFTPSADVRPTENAPIVRLSRERLRVCTLARWGLTPPWAKDLKFGTRCINARAETLATQPAFRSAYLRQRCLVPANAFYEWSGPQGKRSKWRIELRDSALFGLAGLWEWWRAHDHTDAPGIITYTIITSPANAAIEPLHDRMPVIIPAEQYSTWLDPAHDPEKLLVPFDAERMVVREA